MNCTKPTCVRTHEAMRTKVLGKMEMKTPPWCEGYIGARLWKTMRKTSSAVQVLKTHRQLASGLRAGDYILTIDKKRIRSKLDVASAIRGKNAGHKVKVTVIRNSLSADPLKRLKTL